MHRKTLVTGLKVLALAVSLTAMGSLAKAGVIILEDGGTSTDGAAEVLGQSFMTPGGGPWDNITFNFFSDVPPGMTPLALGNAFLLSAEYLGPLSGLDTSTPGYIATGAASGGKYIFSPSLVLNPNTEYWLYVDTAIQTTGDSSGETPSKQEYFINLDTGNFCSCNTSLANFELDGDVVPEPGTWLMGFSGLAILAGLKLRTRRAPRDTKQS